MSESRPVIQSKSTARTNIRWFGGGLVLLLCFVAYLDRSVFSVTAVPIMKALHISTVQFGLLTTVFSIGYFIFQIPGSILVEKRGSRSVLTISLLVWSVFAALTGAMSSFAALIVVRFMFGVGEAPLFPGGNHFFANWFPKHERGRSNSLMNGGSFFSNVVGPPIIVLIVSAIGWRSPFFICGLLGIVVAIVWYRLMRSKPHEHPSVNENELNYITENSSNLPKDSGPQKQQWSTFLKQRSFWMIALGYFSTLWVVQFFIYWLPYYLQVARHLSFKSMGFYSVIPWISITIAVFLAGIVSDALLKRGNSKYVSRNIVCVIALIVSAISLVLSTTATSAIGNILWISLALGMAGCVQTLSWSIATDISRDYTSTVGGWMNTWGFIAASIVPTLAPIIANSWGWNAVLIVNAGIIVLGIIGYLGIRTNKGLVTNA
jgi:ACS family glucarate transporter-like MFS transporter